MRAHVLCAIVALTIVDQKAGAARFEGQFDLTCEGKFSQSRRAWTPHFSIDLGRGLYCAATTSCGKKPPFEIARVTPSSLVLMDTRKGGYGTVLVVSSATDEVRIEIYNTDGFQDFARGQCRRKAFTPFPPIPAL